MGAFKPLLPFGNATVIDNCLSYLRAGGADSIVVVIGHRADELRRHLHDSTVTFAVNPDPKSEMVDSIRCGIAQLPPDAAATLIAPVDYPAIPPQVVTKLIQQWRKGAQLVVPTWRGLGGHPVLIDLCFRHELEALKGSRGLKALFDNNAKLVHRVEVDSPYIAHDIDTWDDYTRLYSEIFGQTPPRLGESNETSQRAI